ncbi:MAG: FAD-dependent oxidoreductase, partial [Chloroflexi bacterium]|nr:FAD-dependent oxidoreductase [Chloroflexota bacterium]
PELPNKLASGRLEDIRPCINCYTCIHQMFIGESMCCAVNPAAGQESKFKPEAPQRAKKVVVVGSGPGGMEAARIAASRGHQVALYEKGHRLGGSLTFASVLSKENEAFLNYLITQVKKLPIEIRQREEVTPGFIEIMNPDTAILAVGPMLVPPAIPGADGRNVFGGRELREMVEGHNTVKKLAWRHRLLLRLGSPILRVLKPSALRVFTHFYMPFGKKVVVIGGDFIACELAEFLAQRGKQVTILATEPEVASEMTIPSRWRLMHSLCQNDVRILTEVKCEDITRDQLTIATKDGERRSIDTNTVIITENIEPNHKLSKAISEQISQIYLVGDCKGTGLIKGAIADAADVTSKI